MKKLFTFILKAKGSKNTGYQSGMDWTGLSAHLKLMLLLVTAVLFSVPAYAADWYVAPTASGTASGNSCSNAAVGTNLQNIINNAAAGDVINLTGGTFTITTAITISKALTLKGAGMGATKIRTGAAQLSPFSITANNVIIRDLTIQEFPGSVGGNKGVYVDGKTGAQILNVEFKDFPAGQNSEVVIANNVNGAVGLVIDGCWFHNGANTNAITVNRNSSTNNMSVTVQNTVIAAMDNSRSFPAGIYYNQVSGSAGGTFVLNIDNCVFSCLTTNARGAAIGLYGGAGSFIPTINISDCTFTGCSNTSSSDGGGAMYLGRRIKANIDRCIFDGNSSTLKGGAIYADGITVSDVDLFVTDCIFRNNTGQTGAVHLRKPGTAILTTDFSNCLFHNNTGSGGPGAIGTESNPYNVNIDKCTFTLNSGSGTTNEAFQNNTGGTMLVTSSIIWGNPANGTTSDEILNTSGTGTINNSVFVVANNTGFSGTGNSAVDPALNGSYVPTSGTAAGYRIPTSVGGIPGDFNTNDEDMCSSRGFTYPTPTAFCINPITESGTASNTGGTAITNVISNDQINGAAANLATNATIAESGSWPSGVTLNTSTGAVVVASGTTAGVYSIDYELCDQFIPPSCKTVSITVTVTAALPVELLEFSAKAQAHSVLLNWATASELQNKGFEIERSADGRNWTAIGWVATQGRNTGQYQYTDVAPFAGINYYRLKQVDNNGYFEYSSIATVQYGKEGISTSVFPNPVKEQLTVAILAPQAGTAQVDLFDLRGQTISTSIIDTEKGINTKIIDTALLPEGIYFLQINNGTERTELIKFVKI